MALLLYWAVARGGGWRWEWKHATWFRVLSALWILVGFGLVGAWAGFCEGGLRGTERVVRDSQLRTEGLDRAGRLAAFAMAWLDSALANNATGRPMPPTEDQWKQLEAFERGETEIPLAAMVGRLDAVEEKVVLAAAAEGKERLRAKMAIIDNPWVGTSVDWTLALVARRTLRGKLGEGAGKAGIDAAEFFRMLPDAARASGDPAGLSHAELSTHIVEHTIIPGIMTPVRSAVRFQQVLAILIALGIAVPPLALFAIARAVARKRATPPAISSPA